MVRENEKIWKEYTETRNDYENRELNQPKRRLSFGMAILQVIGYVILFLGFSSCVMVVLGSSPDPWVRMTSPSGCSGGVFHASRQFGVWIATCKHCVNREGRVSLTFFQDGQRAKVSGRFVRSHPRYDCSIVWVSADHFADLPQVAPLADGYVGPYRGQPVYAVGSYAGGTITPVARHIAISSVDRGAYQFRLNDSAWGGHSGGPVVDAATGLLLGVLWGTSGRTSLVTSNRALLETMYGTWGTGRAQFSVVDDLQAERVSRKPKVEVRANRSDLDEIRREVQDSHYLNDHFDFDFDTSWFRETPRLEWKIDGRKKYSDGWHGQDGFIWQFCQTGGQFT